MTQCRHQVSIALTDLDYCCVLPDGHDGPHRIGISSDFDLVDLKHSEPGWERSWGAAIADG